jgi:tetratricopeptide (TPR) repeat protein
LFAGRLLEGVVVVMVCGAAWAFGADEPVFEFLLAAGLAALCVLWAVRGLLEGRPRWAGGLSAWCLGGLVLLGALQVTPLPAPFLRLASPGAARLRGELLPREPEALPDGSSLPAPAPTISLYPGATRRHLFQLLGVFLLFAAVRANLASLEARRRLTAAVFINGVLLALFGLLQHLTARSNKGLYWAFPAPAPGFFGPFASRNTYSFYANLCVGPGLALLLASRDRLNLAALSRSPRALWALAGLAVLFASIVLCQSRGGLVSFAAAAVACAAVGVARAGTLRPTAVVAAAVVASLLLLSWVGFEWKKSRLLTLADPDALEGAAAERTQLWAGAVPVVTDCLALGVGYGTFTYLQVGHRPLELPDRLYVRPAHNDYVQYALDGGAVSLLLALVLTAHLLRRAYRASGALGHTERALALGGAFSLLTLAVHSAFSWGVHLPAVALLAAVVCAHLDALPPGAAGGTAGRAGPRRFGPLLAAAAALCLAGAGLAVAAEGYRVYRAQQYLMAAYGMKDCPRQPVTEEYRLACLTAAERWLPDNARLQVELGQAHFRLYQREQAARYLPARSAGALANLFSLPDVVGGPVLAAASARPGRAERPPAHFVEALRHYLRARDLCPLLAKAHVRIAAHVEALGRAGPREGYLRRAQSLLPLDPELWYRSGVQELADGRPDEAVANWRRSLELSGAYLIPILRRARKHLSPQVMETRLLPDKPVILAKAAAELFPGPALSAGRARLQEKAVLLLERPPEPLTAEEWYLKAGLHRTLGQLPEAVASYRAALLRKPRQDAWRLDLARALLEQGQAARARQELLAVLQHDPGNQEARRLLVERGGE